MDACFTAFDKDCDGYLNLSEFECICRALFRNDRGRVYSLSDEQVKDVFEIFDLDKSVDVTPSVVKITNSVPYSLESFLFIMHLFSCCQVPHSYPPEKYWLHLGWLSVKTGDRNDGKISRDEFTYCWNNWIKTIVRPVSAFLVIDVQNDFISGSLSISQCAAQQNGLDVIQPINRLLETVSFDAVFYSLDWHPSDHVSFIDNLPYRKVHSSSAVTADEAQTYDTVTFDGPHLMHQRLWPRHCVQESWGAELHKDLKIADNSTKVYKGTNPDVDSYSVFWDNKKLTQTTLSAQLAQKGATDIYVCGLAYDVCVGATAVDALSIGYRTILIDDCCRGVDLNDIERTKKTVINNHGVIINTDEVKAMVEGRDRRPELGYKLALELKKKLEMGDSLVAEAAIANHISLSEEEVAA